MTGTVDIIKAGNDVVNSKIATGAFNWIMVKFFGNHYIKYFVRKNVLEGVAEAEAKKQLEQFVNNPSPMLAFMQAESELEYKNMFGTLAKTLPKIKNGIPNDDKVNLDTMKRLKDLSKDFSSDDMQEIVAGILAGEYNQPGTFSLRTIEVVRNLTKNDIELFQKFCGYVFDGKNFFSVGFNLNSEDLPILRSIGIGYDEYLYLQDIGLVGNSRNISREFGNKLDKETEYEYSFSIQNEDILLYRKGATTITGLGTLTKAGEELLSITGFVPNEKLKKLVVKHFIKLGFNKDKSTKVK